MGGIWRQKGGRREPKGLGRKENLFESGGMRGARVLIISAYKQTYMPAYMMPSQEFNTASLPAKAGVPY